MRLIDQTRLPLELTYVDCRDVGTVFEAIRSLRVRGAPAIGIAAAYGVCVGLQSAIENQEEAFFSRLEEVAFVYAFALKVADKLGGDAADIAKSPEDPPLEL